MRVSLPGILASSAVLLSGCGLHSSPSTAIPVQASVHPTGRVMGGQQPVAGAAIQLYAVATAADGAPATPLLTSSVATDAAGAFNITGLYSCPSASSLVYLVATGGNPGATAANPAIALMTALGPCGNLSASTYVQIDERTTVAAVTALSPFMRGLSAVGSSSLDAAGLSSAFTLASAYADPSSGQVPGPGLPANASAPVATINTLADILAACINSDGSSGSACGVLFAASTPTGSVAPTDTIAALLNVVRDPAANAAALYALSAPTAPFQPQLTSTPSDWTVALSGPGAPPAVNPGCSAPDLTGASAFTNFTLQQPQICRSFVAANIPAPDQADSPANYSTSVQRTAGQMPIVPPGFKVTYYGPSYSSRYLLAEPNGDLLMATPAYGLVTILRGVDTNGAYVSAFNYASGLTSPYGMAFYPSAANPQYLYVANTASIVRFPFTAGDTVASGAPTTLATDIPDSGNHTTRALAFTQEATPRLLVSVGSANNITNTDADTISEFHRADILAYSLDGTFQKIYASGLRNPVGLVLDSKGVPWTSVNERDGLGDNTPAEYVTHVQEDGFYGWPWYYNGANPDPRLPLDHPELASKTIVGDTLLQAHFAPLQINFYTGQQFPTRYRGDLFVCSHGSWNKTVRAGYELVRVRLKNGVATGEYEDFMTGFVNADGTVWGRPAGVVTGADGALYVADDVSNSIWRITYTGK